MKTCKCYRIQNIILLKVLLPLFEVVHITLCVNFREYKRDGLNIICRIANHHADILYVPAELHMVNEAVMQEVDFLCVTFSFIASVILLLLLCFFSCLLSFVIFISNLHYKLGKMH